MTDKKNTLNISKFTVTIFSIFFFFIWTAVTAVHIFQLNGYLDIIYLAFVFLGVFLLFVYIFSYQRNQVKLEFNYINLSCALFITFALIIMHNSPLEYSLGYIRTFSLLESENLLGWSVDTVFHTSVIQSIINFGYPSTGQNGAPLLGYHVLSHYVDALILQGRGLEPFDNYTLMYYFKSFLFLISILFFVNVSIGSCRLLVYLLGVIIFLPICVAHWQGVWSHGLWFTSVVLLFSAPRVFNILVSQNEISKKQYIFICTLIVIISFGKISTGFMYATFVGFFILMKEYKRVYVYLLGVFWILFFYVYLELFFSTMEDSPGINLSKLSLSRIYKYITNEPEFYYSALSSIYASMISLLVICFVFKRKVNYIAFISAFISFCVLMLVTMTVVSRKADIFFFQYGLYSILILYIFQSLFYNIKLDKIKLAGYGRFKIIGAFLFFVLISNLYYLPLFNIFNINFDFFKGRLNYINNGRFAEINKVLPVSQRISLKRLYNKEFPSNFKRPLYELRDELNSFMARGKLEKSTSLLFIPKKIMDSDVATYQKGKLSYRFGNGLFMYAVLGVPLIYGINDLKRTTGYGQVDYDTNALYKNKVNYIQACEENKKFNNIITLKDFNNKVFDVFFCLKPEVIEND